jgi:hypothetical protein
MYNGMDNCQELPPNTCKQKNKKINNNNNNRSYYCQEWG